MKTQTAKAENASGASAARRQRTTAVRTSPSATTASAPVSASLQIKYILVPIDFSAPSKKALDYAVPFAEQFGAKLTLLHEFVES